jgi:flagellar biosynthesis protein FliQ
MSSHLIAHEFVLKAVREGLLLVVLLSAPPLLASLLVGLVVGVLQTATQIHEQTLMLVPKLLAVGIVVVAMGPVLGAQLLRFSQALLLAIPAIR